MHEGCRRNKREPVQKRHSAICNPTLSPGWVPRAASRATNVTSCLSDEPDPPCSSVRQFDSGPSTEVVNLRCHSRGMFRTPHSHVCRDSAGGSTSDTEDASQAELAPRAGAACTHAEQWPVWLTCALTELVLYGAIRGHRSATGRRRWSSRRSRVHIHGLRANRRVQLQIQAIHTLFT